MITLLIADMAGTTVEDGGHVLRTFMQTCETFGVEVTEGHINGMMGMSKAEVFAALGIDSTAAEKYFNQLLIDSYLVTPPREIPGALEAFRHLRSNGCRVALNTGFHHLIGNRIVDMLGWRDEIDMLVCGDEVPAGRPAPYMIFRTLERLGHHNMHEVAVIDDTRSGVAAGMNSGAALSIGVRTGTDQEFHADIVTDSIVDVPILLGWG